MNWDLHKSAFVLFCIVLCHHSNTVWNMAKYMLLGPRNGPQPSANLLYNKGYRPENTIDEGGSAEKSQECLRYPPVVLF